MIPSKHVMLKILKSMCVYIYVHIHIYIYIYTHGKYKGVQRNISRMTNALPEVIAVDLHVKNQMADFSLQPLTRIEEGFWPGLVLNVDIGGPACGGGLKGVGDS